MKTVILNKEETQEIDWDKPQWLICEEENVVVLSVGKHDRVYFEAFCLPCDEFPKGTLSDEFIKKAFIPIPKDGLTIKITNE